MDKKKQLEKWNKTLEKIKADLTPISYDTWFKPLVFNSVDEPNKIIYFEVFNALLVKVINERYLKLLETNIQEVFGEPLKVSFNIPTDTPKPKKENKEYTEEFYFNPRYTFDTFVVGDHNKYAHAAAVAVAESPSKAYNPLFIYGGSGLGKTHLMHAIGCYIMQHHPDLKVLYVSSEMFTNELIDAIRDTKNNKKKTKEFKEKYRNQDVLLIDDIQFIEGKDSTEIELFHTFNALYENNRQIIISSDRAPNKLVNLDERLRSRFEWNIIADIQAPDYETRVAILQRKAELEGIRLNDDVQEVIGLIAEKIKFNVRELEGALNRIISFSTLMGEDINIKFAKDTLKDILSNTDSGITPDLIKKKVCKKFNLKLADMESSKRVRAIAFPRQIAMYLCREMTELSFPKIGEYFGGRDHTTVLHAYEKIRDEIKFNDETKQIVNELITIINEE